MSSSKEREPATRRVSADERNVISWRVPNELPSNATREGNAVVSEATDAVATGKPTTAGPEQPQSTGKAKTGSDDTQPNNGSTSSSGGGSSGGSSGNSACGGRRGGECEVGGGAGGARLWAYLFRNVNRAVDELYYLCDAEEAVEHCQEAAQLLELCGRDFYKLVERIQDQRRFELGQEEDTAGVATASVGDLTEFVDAACCPRGGNAGSTSYEAAAPRQAIVEGTAVEIASSFRRPKGGLSWEVRKNTPVTCGGAGSIIMTAIGRMGLGQAQGATAGIGGGTHEEGIAAAAEATSAATARKGSEQRGARSRSPLQQLRTQQQALLVPAVKAAAAACATKQQATVGAAAAVGQAADFGTEATAGAASFEGEAVTTPRRALRAAAKPFYPSFAAPAVAAAPATVAAARLTAAGSATVVAAASSARRTGAGKAAGSANRACKGTGRSAAASQTTKEGKAAAITANAVSEPPLKNAAAAAAAAAAAVQGGRSSSTAATAAARESSATPVVELSEGGAAASVSMATTSPPPPAAWLPKASSNKAGTQGTMETVTAAAAAAAGPAAASTNPAAPLPSTVGLEAGSASAVEPPKCISEKAADAAAAAAADAAAEADEEADYAAATERIWAEAEAWVEAEAAAEDEAWAALSRDGPADAGINGGGSTGSSRGVGFRTAGGSIRLADLSVPGRLLGSGGPGVAAGRVSLPANASLEISIPDGTEPLLLLQQPRRRVTAVAASAAGRDVDVVADYLDTSPSSPLPPRWPRLPPKPLSAPAQLPPGVVTAGRINWGVAALLAAQGDLQSSWGSSGSFSDFEAIGGPLTDPLGSRRGGRGGVAALLDDYFGASEQFQPSTGDPASAADGFASDCGVGGSGPRLRNLHRKFSSPDRKRPTPAEAKRRHDRRQSAAAMNRAQLAHGLRQKLQLQSDRARVVSERQAQRLAEREKEFQDRLHQADARRVAHRQGIVRKASDENNKVDEVLFINKLTVEDLSITLQMRLQEVERKIESGRERRLQHLTGISARQKLRRKERVEQMTERRFELEKAASERWSKLEARLETVQERRAARIEELRRRREETAELQARAAVRREARCEEIAIRAKEKEVRREQASVKREQILGRPGSLSALGDGCAGAGSFLEDEAAVAAARDSLFAAIRADSGSAGDVSGGGGGDGSCSGAERQQRRRGQAGERRRGAMDSDDEDAALDAAVAAARAESQCLLAQATAATAAESHKTDQGEVEAAAEHASQRRRIKKARQRLSRLSKECLPWPEAAAGEAGEASIDKSRPRSSIGKLRPLSSRIERLSAQLASALPQTQSSDCGGGGSGGGGVIEGKLDLKGDGKVGVAAAPSAAGAVERVGVGASGEIGSDDGGGVEDSHGDGGRSKRRKKKRRPKHDEPGCPAAPMASLGSFPAAHTAGNGDAVAASKPGGGADKLEATLRELQRLAQTARRDGDMAAFCQGGALPLLVRAAALTGNSGGGEQRRQAAKLALSCLSVALEDPACRSFILSADLAAPLVATAVALMSRALRSVRQACDRPASSSAPSQQAPLFGGVLPLQPSNRRQSGSRRDGGGSSGVGSSSGGRAAVVAAAAAAAAASAPSNAGLHASAVVDSELAGPLSSAMLVVLQLVWPLVLLPSRTASAPPADAVSGAVSAGSGTVPAVLAPSEPLLRVQEELLKYLLLSGLLKDSCALLEVLHARAEEILGNFNAWMLVTMVFRLIDAIASFPSRTFKKDTVPLGGPSSSTPLQQPCHEVAELSSGALGGRAVSTVLSGVQEASAIAAPVSLLAALVLAEEARDEAAVTSVSPGSAVSAVSTGSAERSGGPSDRLLALASIAMHAFNQLSKVDLGMVQKTLAAPEVRPEFTYVCDRLLKRFSELVSGILPFDGGGSSSNAGSDSGIAAVSGPVAELEACFGELVSLLGYFALANPANQEMLQWGAAPTLLTRLCMLPFRYFADERRRGVLLPTLVAACLHNAGNRAAAEQHVAAAFLAEYLEGHRRAMEADEEAAREQGRSDLKAPEQQQQQQQQQSSLPPPWMQLSLRLPISMWAEAVAFFG